MKNNRPVPKSSWRTHLLIVFFLFLLAPVHLIPLLPHLSTHVPGDVMDTAEYPLNEWWTAHAVSDLKTNPFNNTYIFYPLGQNMVQHTYTFLDGLFFTLMRPFVSLIVFHNLLILATFFANALAAYCLIFQVTKVPGLAFLGALAFGHCPTLVSYYKTASLLEAYNFVFFILFSYRLVAQPQFKWAILSGLFWGLTLYNYPYYFVFGGLWLFLLTGYQIWPLAVQMRSLSSHKTSPGARILIRISLSGLILWPVFTPRGLWDFLVRWNLINWITLSCLILMTVVVWTIFKFHAFGKSLPLPSPFPAERVKIFFIDLIKSFPFRWNPPSGQEVFRWLGLSALALGMAALVGFPYFLAYFKEEATRVAVGSNPAEFSIYSVDLVSFFAPFNPYLEGLYKAIAGDWKIGRPIVGTPAFLGYGFIVILLWGITNFFRRSELRLWLVAWGVFLLVSLGPYLKFHGLNIESLPLPGYLIRYLPVVESARTISRYLVPVFLFLCLLICLIIKPIYLKLSLYGKKLLLSGLLLMVGFEYGLLPYPIPMGFSNYQVPEVYNVLAQKAKGQAGLLLDLPLLTHSGGRSAGKGETRKLYYQTVHQQKMIGGVSSKLDESVFAFFQKQPAIAQFWSLKPFKEDELAALIYAYNINWIVLDKRYYVPEGLNAYRSVLNSASYIHIFHEDPKYLGLSIDQYSVDLKEKALQYWRSVESLSGFIYPGFTRPLKFNKPAPLELIVPSRLWNDLEIEVAPATVQAFYNLRLSVPEKKEIEIPFHSANSHQGDRGFVIKLREVFPLESDPPSLVRATIKPGRTKRKKHVDGSPFPFSLLSLGQASGFYLTPSQILIKENHFYVDQRGITAFRLSGQGEIREKAFFDTHSSNRGTLDLISWLKNFPQKDYLALVVHDDGSYSFTPEASDLLRSFGAQDPLEKGDWQHNYALVGQKGRPPGKAWEAHTNSIPAFIHTPGQVLELADIRLKLP